MQHNADTIIKLIQKLGYRYATWQVFADFLELSAISLSNAVDWPQREEREKRYFEIINKYEPKEQKLFPELLGELVMALEEAAVTDGPEDVLGKVFHGLELHNKWTGQFFTPGSISDMMGQMSIGDHEATIRNKGYITVSEPCSGSGALILGLAKAMRQKGYNYCSQMVVTAVDVDIKCVHMTYLQLALYGIPAIVIHGDTLLAKEWSRWFTPIYITEGWEWKQQCGITVPAAAVAETPDEVLKEEKPIELQSVSQSELQPADVITLKAPTKKKGSKPEQLDLFEESA